MLTSHTQSHRAVILDRDGVINVEKNYVFRIEEFEFVDGIFNLCALAHDLGFKLIVITNQAGIARGYYTEMDYQVLTAWMLEQFKMRGIHIAKVYHCPYHPTAGIGEYRRDSFDRKPNPGMILRAKDDFQLDLSRSVLIGDQNTDLQAGRAAAVGYNIKLLSKIRHGAYIPNGLEFCSLASIGEWLKCTVG